MLNIIEESYFRALINHPNMVNQVRIFYTYQESNLSKKEFVKELWNISNPHGTNYKFDLYGGRPNVRSWGKGVNRIAKSHPAYMSIGERDLLLELLFYVESLGWNTNYISWRFMKRRHK